MPPNQVQATTWKLPKAGNTAALGAISSPRPPHAHGSAQRMELNVLANSNQTYLKETNNVLYNATPKACRPSYLQHSPRNPRPMPTGGVAPALVVVTSSVTGVSAVNAVQSVTLGGPATGGTFTLTFGGQTTSGIASNAAASAVQTALAALSSIGTNNVSVTGNAGGPYTVTFIGTLAGAPQSTMTKSAASLLGADEVQTVTLANATGGTFTLTFGGQTTAAQAFNETAANLQTALTGLSSIGAGNATVSGVDGGPYTVTFTGTLANAPQALITANGASLTGTGPTITVAEATLGYAATVTVASVTTGVSAVNAVQIITASSTTGSFRLATASGFTNSISVTASAADAQTAIQAANGIGPGNATVTGNNGGPWTVTFVSALAGRPVPLLVPVRE